MLRRIAFALALALGALAGTAQAATVGDPGTRSLTLGDTSSAIFHSVAGGGGSGPVSVDVRPDGSFSVPDGLFSWTLTGTLPAASSGNQYCSYSFPNTSLGNSTLTTSAGSGTLDPQGDSADLTLPATYTPAAVNVHVTTGGSVCSGSGSWTWQCTADPVPLTLHLHGDGDDVDLAGGALHLEDPSATAPADWTCSGGGGVGDTSSILTTVLTALHYSSSAVAGSTGISLDGTLSPGVHEPVVQPPATNAQTQTQTQTQTLVPSPQVTAATPAAQCVVPKLKGMKLKKAKRLLSLADCGAGKVTKKKSRAVKRGRVIKSKPGAHAQRPGGFLVKLVVAR